MIDPLHCDVEVKRPDVLTVEDLTDEVEGPVSTSHFYKLTFKDQFGHEKDMGLHRITDEGYVVDTEDGVRIAALDNTELVEVERL